MAWEERIIYSREQMVRSLENMLDRLKVFRYDSTYRSLLGDDFVNKLTEWDNTIRTSRDNAFTVVVIGDFKRGKSTFINALLGEEVVTTDVTTETVTLNRISYGVHGNEAVLSEKRRIRLSDNELKREELEKIMADADGPITRLELKRPYKLLENITIIDTPGTGDAMKDFSDLVKESLLQADAVIYIYNVKYPLSQSEQLFLRAAVVPQLYTTLFLVGNYADTVGSLKNYEKVRKLLEGRVHGLLPEEEIITISALDEVCRITGEERPCKELQSELESQFARLRERLDILIDEKKDTVLWDRMGRLTLAMAEELGQELDSIDAGLEMSSEDARKVLARMQEERLESVNRQSALLDEIDTMVSSMRQQTTVWMQAFLERMEQDSRGLEKETVDTILKYYSFYCVDLLQEALNTCLAYHREELFEYMEKISGELAGQIAMVFNNSRNYNFRMSIDNKIWTKGDTAGMAISIASSFTSAFGVLNEISNVASLIVDGVTGILRENEKETKTGEIAKQISGKLTGLNLSVIRAVNGLYQELGDSAKKLITGYYSEEMKNAEHLFHQSADVAGKQEEEKDKIRKAVQDARRMLQEITEELS